MIRPKPGTGLMIIPLDLDRIAFQAQKTFNTWPIIYLALVVFFVFASWCAGPPTSFPSPTLVSCR